MAVFHPDSDGYLSRQCPRCNVVFKLKGMDGHPCDPDRCPVCGHIGNDCWWTNVQVKYINALVTNSVETSFEDRIVNAFRHSKSMRVTRSRTGHATTVPPEPIEAEQNWPVTACNDCGDGFKIADSAIATYCANCGVTL